MKFLLQKFECTQTTYKLHTLQLIYGYRMATNIFVLGSMATSLCISLHLVLCKLEDLDQVRDMARWQRLHTMLKFAIMMKSH
jgi:hypothetical protein